MDSSTALSVVTSLLKVIFEGSTGVAADAISSGGSSPNPSKVKSTSARSAGSVHPAKATIPTIVKTNKITATIFFIIFSSSNSL